MKISHAAFAASLVLAITAARSSRVPPASLATSPCTADSNYQRLAFWIGDWEVLDSTGARYATERVRPALDDCAITAEWTGRGGNKGLNLSAWDRRSGEWRQVYVANQQPTPSGVTLRRSDPAYDGPGIRFVALIDPPPAERSRSRVTIFPMPEGRVMQLFETSSDGGASWQTQFKAEHRRLKP